MRGRFGSVWNRMRDGYIDVGKYEEQYKQAVQRLKDDGEVSSRNKELILAFDRDAALGKTVLKRAKKKIGYSRLKSSIGHLLHLVAYVQMDLDMVKQADMERFIIALEHDEVRSRFKYGSGAPLSESYKVDIKVTVKKFYRWLLGDNRENPPLVSWIDTFVRDVHIPALTPAEVADMLVFAKTVRTRGVVQALFDGGFRVGELLNIRLGNVKLISVGSSGARQQCFGLWVPVSKTFPRMVILPQQASSQWLHAWLKQHPEQPSVKHDGTLQAERLSTPLFPIKLATLQGNIRQAGHLALGKRVWPHLLRHSSATYYANKMPYFQFCKRFGWGFDSPMPRRYIDRAGVDEVAFAEQYHQEHTAKEEDEVTQLREEVATLKAQLATNDATPHDTEDTLSNALAAHEPATHGRRDKAGQANGIEGERNQAKTQAGEITSNELTEPSVRQGA